MILRNFKKEDAPIIAEWLRSEEELYKWSADRFNKYPLTGEDINENYAPQIESGRFYARIDIPQYEEQIAMVEKYQLVQKRIESIESIEEKYARLLTKEIA